MAEKLDIKKIHSAIKKTKKYKVDYATPNGDGALFLPSISSLYAKHVSKDDSTVRKGNGPAGMTSIKQLDLLDPVKGMFWYPWVLYSAGHAQLDLTKTDIQESMIQKRNKNRTFVLADSGGYQLSTGVLKGDIGNIDDMEAQPASLRHKILKWMEHTADFSMILDIPTTSCKNPKSIIYKKYPPYFITYDLDKDGKIKKDEKNEDIILKKELGYSDGERFYKCLEYTVKNNAYFIKHRDPEKTKLLNVLQGRDILKDGTGENDIWYNVVKYFSIPEATMADVKDAYNEEIRRYGSKKIGFFEIDKDDHIPFGDRAFEGWAIPGNLKFDFQMLMKRFKIMAKDGFLENKDENLLIHFLGISRVSAGLLYTAVQTELRNNYNPNIIITYDAASPFVCTAKGKGYGNYTVNRKKMTYAMETLPDKRYIETDDSGARWYSSPERDDTGKRVRILKTYDPGLKWHEYHKANKVISVRNDSTYSMLFDGGDTYRDDIIREDTTLGDMLLVKDICYKDGKDDTTKSYWDGTSYVYIMNMNVEQHIRAIQEAYKIYFQGDAAITEFLPPLVSKGKNAIEQIIRANFSDQAMKRYLRDLENILGMKAQQTDGALEDIIKDEGIDDD